MENNKVTNSSEGIKTNIAELISTIIENKDAIKDYWKENNIEIPNPITDEIVFTIGKWKVTAPQIIIFICWFIGLFIIIGFAVIQGLQSFFRYWDQIPLGVIRDWLFRKDPLNLPMSPLIISLLAVSFIYGGVEVSVNFLLNKESPKGDIKVLPKKQRDRLFSLVILWFIMTLLITLIKWGLGTRNVNYCEELIYAGFGQSFALYVAAQRAAKFSNKLSGSKDKLNERMEEAVEMAKIIQEEKDVERKEYNSESDK